MNESKEPVEAFNFAANRLCLDFTNTLHDRGTAIQRDHFSTYADLVWWSQAAGILQLEETKPLLEEARLHPQKATQTLQKAVALRETMYRIFSAIVGEDAPEATDLQALNAAYAEAMGRACIIQNGDAFTWDWQGKETTLERMVWDIVCSAAELLVSTELHLLHECAGADCGWLFLDTSKNHSRRWCDMKGCGNRAKVGRHYEKNQRKRT